MTRTADIGEKARKHRQDIDNWKGRFSSHFSRGDGPPILSAMLEQLRFFDSITNAEEMARHNYAVELLRWTKVIEVNESGEVTNAHSLVQGMLNERTE